MITNYKISDYRYEKKFIITELSRHEVESIVKLHPAIFSEIYHQRFVNNIYFDSFNFHNFHDNIDGSTNRIKIRIRWYNTLFRHIESPVLELKIKNGLLGTKISIPLKPFKLDKNANISDITNLINEQEEISIIDLKSLRPSLLNRYSRKYYESCNKQYRITIDTKQSFYQVFNENNSFLNKHQDNTSVILELKYNKRYDSNACSITEKFPFRISKSSKYVNGVQKVFQIAY